MTTVDLIKLRAGYGETAVLHEVSLQLAPGELLALLGPSGCGKTTLLKLIAGLLSPAAGDLMFNGQSVLPQPAEKRDVAVVFQKPLLFPYLTVAENIGFGLKMRGCARADLQERVTKVLKLVHLTGFEERKPHELSGGQAQRAALARALVTKPRVLLLDEPFSALDNSLRAEMRDLLRNLQQRLHLTTLFVTHDQAEAAALADRIALLLEGKLAQVGPPRDFYLSPLTPQVARFFGWKVVMGELRNDKIETAIGSFPTPATACEGKCQLAFRPQSLWLSEQGTVEGVIETVFDLGWVVHFRVRLADGDVVEVSSDRSAPRPQVGERVSFHLPITDIRYFA